MKPQVSILVTSFNREKYIAECLDSILNSTFTNFELIIVDDASSDNTVEICRQFERKDDRIKLYVNQKNLGQFQNRNKAASLANADLIKYFDSDDILHKHSLEKMVHAMLAFPEAGAGSGSGSVDVVNKFPHLFDSREIYIGHFFNGNHLLNIGPSGTIMRRKAFENAGRFNEKIGVPADTLLMLKIAAVSPIVAFEPNLIYWRRHDDQAMTNWENNFYQLMLERKMMNDLVLSDPNCPLTTEEKNIIFQNMKNIFIRKLLTHFLKLKSASKVFSLMKSYNIGYADFVHSLSKNKRLTIDN